MNILSFTAQPNCPDHLAGCTDQAERLWQNNVASSMDLYTYPAVYFQKALRHFILRDPAM